MVHFLRDKMKDLHASDDFPRELDAIGNDHGFVIGVGLTGGEAIARVSSLRH